MSGLDLYFDFYAPLTMGLIALGSTIFFHRAWKKNEVFRSKFKYKYLALFPICALYLLSYALYHLPQVLR